MADRMSARTPKRPSPRFPVSRTAGRLSMDTVRGASLFCDTEFRRGRGLLFWVNVAETNSINPVGLALASDDCDKACRSTSPKAVSMWTIFDNAFCNASKILFIGASKPNDSTDASREVCAASDSASRRLVHKSSKAVAVCCPAPISSTTTSHVHTCNRPRLLVPIVPCLDTKLCPFGSPKTSKAGWSGSGTFTVTVHTLYNVRRG
mmetsp:Transcript_34312/g.99654  ORF Transcript_34312/g.99654 Transcript_34312/m.99654 type:complete len:206 (+) Transcript_34312:1337-1954(+)